MLLLDRRDSQAAFGLDLLLLHTTVAFDLRFLDLALRQNPRLLGFLFLLRLETRNLSALFGLPVRHFLLLRQDGKGLLLGNTEGQLVFFPNVGTDEVPRFDGSQLLEADGEIINLSGVPRSRPCVADVNGEWGAPVFADTLALCDSLQTVRFPARAGRPPLIESRPPAIRIARAFRPAPTPR